VSQHDQSYESDVSDWMLFFTGSNGLSISKKKKKKKGGAPMNCAVKKRISCHFEVPLYYHRDNIVLPHKNKKDYKMQRDLNPFQDTLINYSCRSSMNKF
jgi:hypothetical protein